MPTNYTATPGNAPATNTLPSDLDDATAESVNLALRAAADNLMGLAAIKANANTFAQPQTIDFTASDSPMIRTTKRATDDTTNASSRWKLILELPSLGTRLVRLYVGTDPTAGAIAITVNAWWHVPGSLNWRQDDTGQPSFALLVIGETLTVSHQIAGASAWSAWPTNAGDATLGGNLSAANVFASNTSTATQGFATPGTTGGYAYAPLKTRPASIMPTGVVCIGGHNLGQNLIANGTRAYVFLSVSLPSNATAGDIEIIHYQDTTTSSTFELMECTVDFTTPGPMTYAIPADDTSTRVTTTGWHKTTISIGFSFDPTKEYRLRWEPGSGADMVAGVQMINWQDNGPYNDL